MSSSNRKNQSDVIKTKIIETCATHSVSPIDGNAIHDLAAGGVGGFWVSRRLKKAFQKCFHMGPSKMPPKHTRQNPR